MTTSRHVENWLRARGGIVSGLPRLRDKVKSGLMTAAEVALVKEYLANLDATASTGAAGVGDAGIAPGTSKKAGNTAVVVAIMVAAFAAALVAVR